MDVTEILAFAEELEELRWKAEAYDSIATQFEDKRTLELAEVDHTRDIETQIEQLLTYATAMQQDGQTPAALIVKEFVQDVDSAYGKPDTLLTELLHDWYDLANTYQKAKTFLETITPEPCNETENKPQDELQPLPEQDCE